jgi:uncharacterized protein YbjT (DUF2867 family)
MLKILITGATGHVGGEVLRQLTGHGHSLRAMSRNPAGLHASQDVEPVRGDLMSPETLDPALEGVDRVFLV